MHVHCSQFNPWFNSRPINTGMPSIQCARLIMQLSKKYGAHNGTPYLPILKMHSMAVTIEFSGCIYVETTLLQCVISH